jgi:hypothetical protein
MGETSLPTRVPSNQNGIAASANAVIRPTSRDRGASRLRNVKPCVARSMKQGMTSTVRAVDDRRARFSQFFHGREASHSFHALAAARHSGKS